MSSSRTRKRFVWWTVAAAALLPAMAAAEEAAPGAEVGELVVFGRAETRIGTAAAASEGAIAGGDLTIRPLLRTAEILEAVPGMIVTQHSGSGKANQYFLRGFNLDHGTDFAFFIDGVPMNFRTHGHGQGYLDLNGMIPETLERVDYRKGPYRADVGDFALVGMAAATTRDHFDAPFVSAEAGAYDWKRLAAGGSWEVGGGDLLIAADAKTYDGPWELPERFRPLAGYAKFTRDTPLGMLRVSLSAYKATWNPTEQIPERAIGTLVKDAYGALDHTLKGSTERQILAASLKGADWRAEAYLQRYDWSMVSNFTFFLDDPVLGDQLEQSDRLWTWGGRLERTFKLTPTLSVDVGFEGRNDKIGKVGLYHDVDARRIAVRSAFAVDEASGALYAEATWRPTEKLKLMLGARGDAYRFKVRALDGAAWSGEVDDRAFSPKAGISYEVFDGVALYGNWGKGLHSNDARGVTNPDSPSPGLVQGEGRELGLRLERWGVVASANLWWMSVDSELIYVGDAGSVEPFAGSERKGYELTAFWRPTHWLAIDGVWTGSRARFKDSPGFDYIPGALDNAGELGAALTFEGWNAAVRVRHLGAHALVEDNSRRSEPTTIVNLRAAWTPGRYEVFGELLNAFDSHGKDIEYFYASRLPGEPLEGVEDVHSRAVEPRMVRAGVKMTF